MTLLILVVDDNITKALIFYYYFDIDAFGCMTIMFYFCYSYHNFLFLS